MVGPLNGTGNQVREQADKQTVIEERPRGLDASFVHVHDVGDFLKRIKRYPRGKKDADQRQRDIVKAEVIQHADKGAGKKVKIFENSENREVQNQREGEPFVAIRVLGRRHNLLGDQEIDRGTANHEGEKAPVPPAVEEVTCQ